MMINSDIISLFKLSYLILKKYKNKYLPYIQFLRFCGHTPKLALHNLLIRAQFHYESFVLKYRGGPEQQKGEAGLMS